MESHTVGTSEAHRVVPCSLSAGAWIGVVELLKASTSDIPLPECRPHLRRSRDQFRFPFARSHPSRTDSQEAVHTAELCARSENSDMIVFPRSDIPHLAIVPSSLEISILFVIRSLFTYSPVDLGSFVHVFHSEDKGLWCAPTSHVPSLTSRIIATGPR